MPGSAKTALVLGLGIGGTIALALLGAFASLVRAVARAENEEDPGRQEGLRR
ncbi:hypothetical protein ACIPPN_26935 [Streptomyces diastaticus]|uniref:Uncharacterized protein n=1 Tax=Streptomyces diastaticus subsp. diastaticus TaxID=68040 RepID=A0ABQ1CXY2_STRDI|nr:MULTISPECIES: hypothetical protein [Streptomyces]GFH75182.1 hypothetical protein Sdia_59500 [Streptomyces diastaticus subsp. diastaticus]GGU45069.1 hypothetical protein GCM10015534_54470 [Streptomyces diastaticus subsp. diastaticus]